MANDFKRMWTKEELKDTYVLKLDDFSTGGEVYHKYGYTKDLLIKMSYYDKILVIDKYGNHLLFNKKRTEIENGEPYIVAYSLLEGRESNILYLNLDEGDNYNISISYFHLTDGHTHENLVRETPTDVSIIEDQGKLELMLEHDGNVLAINDTPNQFLQRRLDKPTSQKINIDLPFSSNTFNQVHAIIKYVGQFVKVYFAGAEFYGIVTDYDEETIQITPLGVAIAYDTNQTPRVISIIQIRIDERWVTILNSDFTSTDNYSASLFTGEQMKITAY